MLIAHTESPSVWLLAALVVGVGLVATAVWAVATSRTRGAVAALIVGGLSLGAAASGLPSEHGADHEVGVGIYALQSELGCRADEAPVGDRRIFQEPPDGFYLFAAHDFTADDAVLAWCEELSVRAGSSEAVVSAGGPFKESLLEALGPEVVVQRIDGTSVWVEDSADEHREFHALWLDGSAVVYVRGTDTDVLHDLVAGVTVGDETLNTSPPLDEVRRTEPASWLIGGAPRSTVIYGSGGTLESSQNLVQPAFDQTITVETIRNDIDAEALFPEPGEYRSHRIDDGEVTIAADEHGIAVIIPTGDAIVLMSGDNVPEEHLTSLVDDLVPVDRRLWRSTTDNAGEDPSRGQVEVSIRHGDETGGREIALFLGPILVLVGAIAIGYRLVRRGRS